MLIDLFLRPIHTFIPSRFRPAAAAAALASAPWHIPQPINHCRRRIMFAPTSALICVLFHDGEFGVWDLDAQTLVAHT
jgi:hypothetical protein